MKRINKMNLIMVLLWTGIFQFYIPNEKIYYVYDFFVAIIVFIISIFEIRKIPGKLFVLFYPLVIIISCLINRNAILYTQVMRGITYAILILDIILYLHKYVRKYGTEKMFNILYRICRFYFFINMIWIFALEVIGKLENAIQNEYLFLCGKFPTAYMMIFYLLFFMLAWSGNLIIKKKRKKIIFVLLVALCVSLCWLIETSTGVLAILLFGVLVLIPKNEKILKIFCNPIVLCGTIIGSMMLIFSINMIISSSFVQNLITNILHEDMTLTGRTQLYSMLSPLLLKAGSFGSGFGSYVTTQLGYHKWYNAQNGLAEIILTYGYVGGGAFLGLVFNSAIYNKKFVKQINAAILVFIIVAVVEIPFNLRFIFLISIFMCSGIEETRIKKIII